MIVAFSGGKDSTAMALELHRRGVKFKLLHTPTGNELPGVAEHVQAVADHTGAELILPPGPTLGELIEEQQCLPNWRMRWCTRMIKIEPAQAWLAGRGETLAVGLRADEEGRAGGTYDVPVEYPLREWNWGLQEVLRACEGWDIPERTDCAACFYQTLHEWCELWLNHPDLYKQAVRWENMTGHTFRSPSRDTRPAALRDLAAMFISGYRPPKRRRKAKCRLCSA